MRPCRSFAGWGCSRSSSAGPFLSQLLFSIGKSVSALPTEMGRNSATGWLKSMTVFRWSPSLCPALVSPVRQGEDEEDLTAVLRELSTCVSFPGLPLQIGNPQFGRKYLQIMWLKRDQFPKFINSSRYFTVVKQTTPKKNGQKT